MEPALYEQFDDVEDWYWWSVGTRAIFREWLAGVVRRGGRILDVGCGTGALTRDLATLGRVVGVDVAPAAIAFARRRAPGALCAGSVERLPFRTAVFDAVAAVDVVEHVDDAPALAELARVLAPGGVALIHVPAFPLLWGEHDVANRHRRRYRRARLVAAVAGAGLAIERLSYVNCLLFPVALAARLAKRGLGAVRRPRAPRAEIYDLPGWANRGLTALLGVERVLLRRVDLPVGVSLLCLARKAG
jgi:SAM-dependent methyltransferase